MSEELRTCGICEHDEARVIVVEEVTDAGCEEASVPLYAASCWYCGARGPMALSEDEAVEAWNRRAERTCRMVDCSTHDTCVVNRELVNGDVMSMEFGYRQCSECGAYVFDCPTVRYCPRCGARVIKEDSDEGF